MNKLLPLLALLIVSGNISAQLSATTTGKNPNCVNAGGMATVNPTGGGNYGYKWSNGATTQTDSNLTAGTYTVTVYSASAHWDTIYTENFDEASPAWTLNISTGNNDGDHNFWVMDDITSGGTIGSCAGSGTGDKTLYITSATQVLPGATYDAGSQGLCNSLPGLAHCTQTNEAAESGNITTNGVHNLVLSYDFIGNGQALTDNGSSFYSINSGTNFTQLDASLKSTTCGSSSGTWRNRSYNLPSSCNNISTFRLRFQWTNDDDAAGNDPSVAINNILLRDSVPVYDSIVKTVTLTLPTPPHFVTAALSVVNPACSQSNGSINNMGVGGGTAPYTISWQTGGATIGNSFSLTNIGAGTYTFRAVDSNGCTIDTNFTLVSSGSGTTTITTNKDSMCANDSANICAPGSFAHYAWNTGDTTQCIYAHGAGNYYVTATDGSGCTFLSNHLNVNVFPAPSIMGTARGDTFNVSGGSQYQWYRDSVLINGATGNTYIATQPGNYYVIITYGDGCITSFGGFLISGIEELSVESIFRVYPNPISSGEVNIEMNKATAGVYLEVYDASGCVILKQQIRRQLTTLDVSKWAKGIYLLKAGAASQKLVKE